MPDQVARIMESQQSAWNRGDLDGFMDGYLKSDSLMFIGKSGVTYGHGATLQRYKTSYPDKQTMGALPIAHELGETAIAFPVHQLIDDDIRSGMIERLISVLGDSLK